MSARGGICRTCGLDLVQTDERTYHPAAVIAFKQACPDLLPIEGMPGALSFDVPASNFVPAGADRMADGSES